MQLFLRMKSRIRQEPSVNNICPDFQVIDKPICLVGNHCAFCLFCVLVVLWGLTVSFCVEVPRGQLIKLIQVVSISEY